MIEISEEKLNSLIDRIRAIINVDDEEIKNCALLAIIEELEELEINKGLNDKR